MRCPFFVPMEVRDSMKVADVTKNEKKNMLEIRFEDESVLLVYEEDYYGLGLYDKIEFSEDDVDNIRHKTHERLARALALKMILLRKRTRKEIEDKLSDRAILSESMKAALDKLEKEGYIDDERYANRLVQKMRANNKSRKQIEIEFIAKGLDISKLDSIDDIGLDEVVAQNLFDKKFSGKDLSDEKIKLRVYNFLRSKGFSYDVIKKYITI